MDRFSDKKNIFWDFDGVLVDSHTVRIRGFKEILADYPSHQVEELLEYHRKNGGLSRYDKFKYFFHTIRGEELPKEKMEELSSGFSEIMRTSLTDKKFLIQDSLAFVKANHKKFRMHIVSGSDGEELRYLCNLLEISQYFQSIEGSPTPKIKLVEQVLRENFYTAMETVFIGDAINDYEAANFNGVLFYGYNNPELINYGSGYISSFR